MLCPHEFGAGSLSEAQPLSLVLPRDKYELMFLVGEMEGEPYAVCLSEQWKFHGFTCRGVTAHSGLIILNVNIEVDETSLFKVEGFFPPIGAVLREETGIFLGCRAEGVATRGIPKVTLATGLTHYSGQVGFTRWSVTIGKGEQRRVLQSIDLTAA